MKCQSLFSEKSKKNIINLTSAEFAQRVVKVSVLIFLYFCAENIISCAIVLEWSHLVGSKEMSLLSYDVTT